MNEKYPPTLQDIAIRAGCSRATVSLALRNHRSIPATTQERIQAIARKMGYRPNPTVATLMAHVRARKQVGHRETIGFLTGFPTRDGWRRISRLYEEFFQGACERGTQLGFHVEEIWAKEPGMTGRRLTQILLARNIRGVLVASLPRSRGHLTLDWSQFAAAAFGPSLWRPSLHRATYEHFNDFMMVLRQLRKRGYRRIGIAPYRTGDQRINNAYTAALFSYQQTIPAKNRIAPLYIPNHGLREADFRKWFERHRPDVVVGFAGLLNWFRNLRLRVPEDVGFFSFSWHEGNEFAGLDQHGKVTGAAAIDLVVAQLHRNERGIPQHPHTLSVPGEWREGNTIRPR